MQAKPRSLWAGLGIQEAGPLGTQPGTAHLDRLPIASPQEGLVVRFNAEGYEGPRGDIPPVPSRCHALPTLEK